MRWLLLLALVLPAPALALGPAVLDSPDLRQLSAGPMVYGGSDGVTCTFAAGQPPRCSDGTPLTTTRAGTATCIGGGSVSADEPCVSAGKLESFPVGVGGRTAPDVHTVSTRGWPTRSFVLTIRYTPLTASAEVRQLIDTREAFNGTGLYVYANSVGFVAGVGNGTKVTGAGASFGITVGVEYEIRVKCDGVTLALTVNGVPLASSPTTHCVHVHREAAFIGTSIIGESAQGYIGTIRISPAVSQQSVFAIGDSITQGSGATAYPVQLRSMLGPSYWVTNRGRNGWFTSQMRDLWVSEIRAKRPNIVVVLGGVNSVNSGLTAAAIYSELSTIYSQALADGARVIAMTVLPFSASPSWTSAKQATTVALNDLIRATPGITVVDTYAAMGEPGTPTRLRVAYDTGDGLHPNGTGNTKIAELVAGAIQ